MSNLEFGMFLETNISLRNILLQDEIGYFRMFLARDKKVNVIEKSMISIEEYINETI